MLASFVRGGDNMKKLAAFAALAIAALVAVVLGATATGASPGPAGVQRVPWGGAARHKPV